MGRDADLTGGRVGGPLVRAGRAHCWVGAGLPMPVKDGLYGLVTDEGVAFDSDTATGMMPVAHRVAVVLTS